MVQTSLTDAGAIVQLWVGDPVHDCARLGWSPGTWLRGQNPCSPDSHPVRVEDIRVLIWVDVRLWSYTRTYQAIPSIPDQSVRLRSPESGPKEVCTAGDVRTKSVVTGIPLT